MILYVLQPSLKSRGSWQFGEVLVSIGNWGTVSRAEIITSWTAWDPVQQCLGLNEAPIDKVLQIAEERL